MVLVIKVQMPPKLSEATAKFVVMSNVLDGIRDYDNGGWPDPDLHDKTAAAIVQLGKPSSGRPRDLTKDVRRLLRIAWQTELAARVSDVYDDDMLRRCAAQTLPVQAYYAVFNAARAMTTSAGMACGTHQAVHRDFQSQRARRAHGGWGVTLTGDPSLLPSCLLSPKITTPTGFNPMELSHSPEDYVWAALRMTRRWKVEAAREEWLRRNKSKDGKPRKQLPGPARTQLIIDLRATTMMDFLYELRRRTNYEGVDEYGSDAEDYAVERFHRGLLHVADMGMLHYETMLAQYVGVRAYETEVRDWASSAAKVGPWATETAERRLQAIKSARV
jgi:hypothetical protein